MKKSTKLALAVLILLMGAACRQAPRLETRTFRINHLQPWEVEPLVGPYVYTDRAENPGEFSTSEQAVTIRETPDNLDKIARVLEEYDVARPDIRLHFQLIEADGFTTSDPRIAPVEAELRKIFQFRGYRLAGEAAIAATNEAEISQRLAGSDGLFGVSGKVFWVRGDLIHLENIRLSEENAGPILLTSMNVRPGQTVVLGSSPKSGSTATLLLTVRAEAAGDL
ncbi:MAG TPA: hypothetical protein VJ997_00730 [Longimicrobiales bacterium]|nr:hypothetical protein [Longimicrobiales bacterium]